MYVKIVLYVCQDFIIAMPRFSTFCESRCWNNILSNDYIEYLGTVFLPIVYQYTNHFCLPPNIT